MEQKPEEILRIEAINRYRKQEEPIQIYSELGKSKKWFFKWLNRSKTGDLNWFTDLPRSPKTTPNKIDMDTEKIIVDIRKSLMEGTDIRMKYSCVGPEAIQYHMVQEGHASDMIPSIATIKRVIKRNKLKVNKRARYKRVHSKKRYTLIIPRYKDEMHQMDFVGPRHITGYGPINSLHLKDVVGKHVAGYQYKEKSMDNVMRFLISYWMKNPIPKYLQVDNGMCFAGDFKHPKSFSRFVRLCLYVGIEVIFIAPSKPWMNGTIEEMNKGFDIRFWKKETFNDLEDIQNKSNIFYNSMNKYNVWKYRDVKIKPIKPIRTISPDFKINTDEIPLIRGRIHFIREVNSNGQINLLNESFDVGKEYIGEYVWARLDTKQEILDIRYNDENLIVMKIKQLSYKIPEKVCTRKLSIFLSG